MEGHHLILGELVDAVTGRMLPDTLDERYRQKLARLLMDERGYCRTEIQSRCGLRVKAGDNCAMVYVDMAVTVGDRICMIIKYGPGSLITRHRPALAASRLLAPYQVPVVVVTNGEDADILEGLTGEVIASGLESIPARSELGARCAVFLFPPIAAARAEIESRIVYAYEVDGACPCDDSICLLPAEKAGIII
ncbi:MAG: type I restriction enzyme HsdR N-terminal domain-containing protein [Pseudomonadota bacterium]